MKVIIYARVSTAEQTTENQRPILQRWVADHGHELVEVYFESESAWKSGRQQELARVFKDFPRRKVDICLVWALDRLTREGVAAILRIVDRFKHYGVRVVSLQESWTEAPGEMADLLYAIAGWAAKFESQRRSARTRAGIARARAEGKILGRPKGCKDKEPRKTTGYLLRFANRRTREKYEGRQHGAQ